MEDNYVFISYAYGDEDIVMPCLETMRKYGISLWFNEHLQSNSEWLVIIEQKLRGCAKFVQFISKEALSSLMCKRELDLAVSLKKEIFLVHLEDDAFLAGIELQQKFGINQPFFQNKFSSLEIFQEALCSTSFFDDCRSSDTVPFSDSYYYDPYMPYYDVEMSYGCPTSEYLFDESINSLFSPMQDEYSEPILSQVQFSAISPKEIEKGNYAIIYIAMYEEKARSLVDKLIAEADTPVKEVPGSTQSIAANTPITITLTSDDICLNQTEKQVWNGSFLNFSFFVEVPKPYAKKQIMFTATVYFNDVIATRLRFMTQCASGTRKQLEIIREDVLSAFMSYASLDRPQVAGLIMGMKKARPDMDIFFDVESLRSGENWEEVLHREIERRDILFLCWSQNAKESQWVNMEWHYALEKKGLDSIEPIPLVPPTKCPPPVELSSKHFNDKFLLYTINVDDI